MDSAHDAELKNAENLAGDGLYSEAAEAFRSLVERCPGDPEVLGALAGVMLKVGQPEYSLALLADSVNVAEPDPKVLMRIADQLAEVGRLDESADFLICALCSAPEDSMLRLRTETLLGSLGRESQLEWLRTGAEGQVPSV